MNKAVKKAMIKAMNKAMRKTGIFMAVIFAMTSLLAGCSTKNENMAGNGNIEKEVSEDNKGEIDEKLPAETQEEVVEDKIGKAISVAVLKGPTGMGMVKLMEDNANGNAGNNYSFTVGSDASVVLSKLISGDYDIAALPTNAAAVLYGKTEGNIQMLAINTYGNLYLLQNTGKSQAIASVSDLKGKTITMHGQGANPEYVMSYILEKHGLKVGEDVTLDFKGAVDEVLAAVAAGECEFALLPEPNTSVALSKNADFASIINMSEEWNSISDDGKLVMGCIVARKDFIDENKDAVNTFIDEYGESIHYVMEDIDDASLLIEKHEIVASAAVAKKALPGSNLTFITGKDMQEMVEGYFHVLYSYNPSTIGGNIPDEKFYYISE